MEDLTKSKTRKYINCPKCGCSDGYTFQMHVYYTQWLDVYGNAESAQEGNGWEGKIFSCINCRSKFREKTILLKTNNVKREV